MYLWRLERLQTLREHGPGRGNTEETAMGRRAAGASRRERLVPMILVQRGRAWKWLIPNYWYTFDARKMGKM